MRRRLGCVLVVIAVVAITAGADPLPPVPALPAPREIDVSGLVLEQAPAAPKDPARQLCPPGDRYGCEALCKKGSIVSCARLGMVLALGGADNPLLPVTKFDQDFDGAVAPLEKACKARYYPACVDLELVNKKRMDFRAHSYLRETCRAGYGRACTMLAEEEKDEKAQLELYKQGCRGGDGGACLEVAGAMDDLHAALEWSSKAFATPTAGKIDLKCPDGAKPIRVVQTFEAAFTMIQPRWECAVFDERTKRAVEQGPYIEFASEEDELAYPSGIVTERGTMTGGRREGLVERFDTRGYLIEHASYKGGREEGVALRLRRTSSARLEQVTATTYVAGKRDGLFREQGRMDEPPERRTYEEGTYAANQKTGRWLKIEGNHVEEVAPYVAGKLDGERDWYSDDGSLFSRGIWKAGKQVSERRYVRGRVSGEIEFSDGKKTRERELDGSGKVTRVTEYDDDGRAKARKIVKGGKLVDDPDFDAY